MKSPVELLLFFFDDLKRNEPDLDGLDRDIITVKTRFEHEGVGFLTHTLPVLCDALDRGLADGQFSCPSNFRKKGALPAFMRGLLEKVFDSKTGRLVDHPSTRMVKALREILRAFKKVVLNSESEEKLHEQAVADFFELDDVVPDTIPDRLSHLLERVSRYVLVGLNKFDPRELTPKHGPGSVAESLTPNQKWKGVWDAVTNGTLDEYGFDLYGPFTDSYLFASTVKSKNRVYADRGAAKVLSVPKDTSSRRTITAEPLIGQYIQQGLNTVLREEISRCRVLRQCLSLSDQSINQKLALEGSRSGVWATLDLSKASDLLGLTLVETVFGHVPEFLRHMLISRSPEATDGSKFHRLRKYAGMGNATTFPVQSVVFAVIAIAAILDTMGMTPTWKRVLRASRLVRVYGDDIIVPSSLASQVGCMLESLGLRMNNRKSFWTGRFRESCGLDAFMGVDVTPVYLRTNMDFSSTEAGDVASHVATSNLLWKRGLYHASQGIKEAVERALGRALPLVSNESSSLGWETHLGYRTIEKWNRSLHRFEFDGLVLVAKKRPDPLGEYPALLASLSALRNADRRSSGADSRGYYPGFNGEPCIGSPNLGVSSQTVRQGEVSFPRLPGGLDLKRSVKRFCSRLAWRRIPSY